MTFDEYKAILEKSGPLDGYGHGLLAAFELGYGQGLVDGKKHQEQLEQLEPLKVEPTWIVNDFGELGVKVGGRFFFLYKGGNIEYGSDTEGETALHDDGTQMRYRIVGKREFGETCWPLKWVIQGHGETRYDVNITYHQGISFGNPEDGEWKPLPASHDIK